MKMKECILLWMKPIILCSCLGKATGKSWKTGRTRYWLTKGKEGQHSPNTLCIVTTHGLLLDQVKRAKQVQQYQ